MTPPPIPFNEPQRLESLHALGILDTPAEERFDRLTRIAKHYFDVGIALVSLVDSDRQWFKSRQGLEVAEAPRATSFCGHAILGNDIFQIADAVKDSRFYDNPLVTGTPYIRFYAGAPLRAPDGAHVGTLCVVDPKPRHLSDHDLRFLRDIADCAERELAHLDLAGYAIELKSQKSRVQAILDAVLDGVVTIDGRGTIETFNPAAERIFGFAAAEAIGRNVETLIPSFESGPSSHKPANSPARNMARSIGADIETVGRRKDGTTFPMELSISAASVNETRIFICAVRDISRRKRDQEALRELNASLESRIQERTAELHAQRQRMELLLNSAGEGIYGLDLNGRITFMNPAGARILGYSVEDLVGRPGNEAPGLATADGRAVALENCLMHATGKDDHTHQSSDHFMRRKDGAMVPVAFTATPIFDDRGRIAGAITVFRDLSDYKAMQANLAQAQKMEAVGQLTGGVAHDFNNILGIIVGNLDLVTEQIKSNPMALRLVDAAINGAMRGADLIKQLLAFSRRQALDPIVFDVNERLSDMVSLLERALGEAVEIKAFLTRGVGRVLADPVQFESVIVNLAINARDAMPRGGQLTIVTENVRLDDEYVRRNSAAAAGDYVRICIRDNGTGMSPEVLARVFEPFFTTKEAGKGSGLGLSMAYGFVKQSGGHIEIHSEAEHGTDVRVFLPRSDAPTKDARPSTDSPTALPRGNETILLVEDNVAIRETTEEQLINLGYRVHVAENAPAALALIGGGREFDLLFTDIVMPGGMNGYELAAQVRERYPDIKVLYTSGFNEIPKERIGDLPRTGPMLGKPYRQQKLAQMVRGVLDRPSE